MKFVTEKDGQLMINEVVIQKILDLFYFMEIQEEKKYNFKSIN